MNGENEHGAERSGAGAAAPGSCVVRQRPPMDRSGVTHKVTLYESQQQSGRAHAAGQAQQQSGGAHATGQARDAIDFYITLNRYPDGRPCEVFVKAGGVYQGWCDAVCRLVSLLLQHGLPAAAICRQLEFSNYAPCGMVPGFGFARSFTDYLARWIRREIASTTPRKGEPI